MQPGKRTLQRVAVIFAPIIFAGLAVRLVSVLVLPVAAYSDSAVHLLLAKSIAAKHGIDFSLEGLHGFYFGKS